MKLDRYLREHKLSSEKFGKLAGIGSKQVVHKYRHGFRFPTAENLRRIREATNGAVTADDFVDQHAGASPRPGATSPSEPFTPKPKTKRSAAAAKPAPTPKPEPKQSAEPEQRQDEAA